MVRRLSFYRWMCVFRSHSGTKASLILHFSVSWWVLSTYLSNHIVLNTNNIRKGPIGSLPRLSNQPTRMLTESSTVKPDAILSDFSQPLTQVESLDRDLRQQNPTVDIDGLAKSTGCPSQAIQLGDENLVTENQILDRFRTSTGHDLDFSIAPNVLPTPLESSIFIKDIIMKRSRSRSTSRSRSKSLNGWQRIQRAFKHLFWLVFWLVALYLFGRWIDGGVMWTPEMNNAAYWREFCYGAPSENIYLYKETENLREKTKDDIAKIREGRLKDMRRQRKERMNRRPYRCHTWGGCTKYYRDKFIENIR